MFKKIVLYSLAIFVSLLLIVQIPKVNTKITELVFKVALPRGMEAKISPVHGEFPFNIKIDSIKVSDKKGEWLFIENLEFSWGGINLLFGKLDIQTIKVQTLDIRRFPSFVPTEISSKKKFAVPLTVDSYSINQLRILPWFSGSIKVYGETAINQGEAASFSLFAETIDQTANGQADLLELKAEIIGNRLKVFAEANDSLSRFKTIIPELADKIKEGDYEFNIDLEANLDGTDVTGVCNGAINNFLTEDEKFDHFIGDQLDWSVDIRLDKAGKNIIAEGDFSTSNNIKANWNLNFEINNQVYHSVLLLDISQLEHLTPAEGEALTGDIRAIIQAQGQRGLKHQVEWTLTGPKIFGNNIQSCTGNIFYLNQKGNFHSNVTSSSLQTVLQGDFHFGDNQLHLDKISLTGDSHKIIANAVIDLNHYILEEGTINLAVQNLMPWGKFFGQEISGQVSGLFTKKKHQVDANLKADRLIYKGAEFHELIAKISGQDFENFNVTLNATNGHYQQSIIESMTLTAHSKEGKGAFSHHIATPQRQWIAEGALALGPENWKILVNNFKISHESRSLLSLVKPLQIDVNSQGVTVLANALKLTSGEIKFTDLSFGTIYAGKLTLVNVNPQIFNFLPAGYDLSGQIKGDLDFSMDQTLPLIRGAFSLDEIAIHHPGRKTHKSISLATQVKFHDKKWLFKMNYHDSSTSKFQIQGEILTPTLVPAATAKVSMRANGLIDLSVFNSFIWWGDRIKGTLKVDLTTSNILSKMHHEGGLSLYQGEYENADFGTVLRHIELKGSLKGETFRILSLAGKDFKDGTFSGKGGVQLGNLAAIKPSLSLTLNKMLVANNDITALNVSGFIEIKPAEKGAFIIGGNVQTNFGDVFLEDSVQKIKNINLIEVTEQKLLQLKKSKKINLVPSNSTYDLKVQIPNNLLIKGGIIKSRWQGDLHVTGPVNIPEIKGFIEATQGQVDVLGKQMKIKKESKISFTNFEGEVEPVLDIRIEKAIREVMVMIWIHEMAIDPKIEFISVPALAQEEVISLLLFGKSLNSVSAAQSLQLATRLAAIKTGGGGINLMDQFQQAFGLDEFSVGSKEDNDEIHEQQAGSTNGYAVRAGKQLNEKVYFGVEQGMGGDVGTKAVVNIDVTKETKLNLEAGSAGGSVGYLWEKRY